MAKKVLTLEKLTRFSEKMRTWATGAFVAKEEGKGLSTNDYTTDEKEKLAGLKNYSHPTSGVTAGTYKSVTVDANGHVTAGSNPTTLQGFGITDAYTKSQTDTAIATAVANSEHLKRTIVASLPAVSAADENTIYMVPKATSETGTGADNGYNEYMLVKVGESKKFEKIGNSAVDLTDYAKKTYVDDAKTAAVSSAKSYADGLAKNYAAAVHKHTKSDITDFPETMKNPYAMSIKLNGTEAASYDGSSAKSVNITPAGIGAMAADEIVEISEAEIDALFA